MEQDVTVQITHFYEGAPADVDNIAKPILDAMKGLVFGDDSQITDLFCRRRRIRGPFSIDPMSLLIADVIATGGEFVHVRVAASHPTGELRFL